MSDIEKISLKIQDIQADIESLRREVKNKEPQKVEKAVIDVNYIIEQAVSECKKLLTPVKAQQTKAKKDSEDSIDKLSNDIIELSKENKKESERIDKKYSSIVVEMNQDVKSFNDHINNLKDQLKNHKVNIDNTKNHLDKKINSLSDDIKNSIDSTIDKKVNINFVNNLYRNK